MIWNTCTLQYHYLGTLIFRLKKMAFSVSENLEFRFRWAEKRKFRFAIDFVHMEKLKFCLHKIFIKT